MLAKIRLWLIRLLVRDEQIRLRNIYHNRVDTFSKVDLMVSNLRQQQAFPVTLPDGTKSYGQPGHYLELD